MREGRSYKELKKRREVIGELKEERTKKKERRECRGAYIEENLRGTRLLVIE